MESKPFSSKLSPGIKQNLGIGVTFSPSRDEDHYNTPGVEIVDPNQEEAEDPFLNSAGLPVKQHHNKLEDIVNKFMKELEIYRKDLQISKSTLINVDNMSRDLESEVNRYMMEELARLEREFKKLSDVDKSETVFLKQQMETLNQDKIKLQQNGLILESRVTEAESDVGYKQYQ